MQNLSHFLHFEFISRCHNPTNTNSAAFFLIEKVILSLNSCHKLADPDQCHNIVVKHVFIDFFITFDTLWNQIQNDVKPLMKEKSNLMFICNLEILLDNSPDYKLRKVTTVTQWRHEPKKSEILGRRDVADRIRFGRT